MNAQKQSPLSPTLPEDAGRLAVLQHFRVEQIQHLGPVDLLFVQSLAGHGDTWGQWQTPKALSPGHMRRYSRDIDLAQRLRDYLVKEPVILASLETLINEGVLLLTRLALITRLAGTGGTGHGKTTRLKPSTITTYLYQSWPKITARAIWRKANDPNSVGLLGCLIDADLRELASVKTTRIELTRLESLVARDLWADAPPLPNITQTTNPSGTREARPRPLKPVPHSPISDTYMAEIGPRVLWVVRDLGPNLLHLLEALSAFLETVDWSVANWTKCRQIEKFITNHLQRQPWKDRVGNSLTPPFSLITATGRGGNEAIDKLEWPPRTWDHLKILSITLQAAHLFLTLLACAGRVGEIMTLTRNCVAVERDGNDYLLGWTYKLSGNLLGDARKWPAPVELIRSLGQQARLAAIWNRLPGNLGSRFSDKPDTGDNLWVSVVPSGSKGGEAPEVKVNHALMMLAERLGMDPRPDGKNLHAHRFRKTIGRLGGIALFNSPLVLKRLFGHKSIEMTLHYILCDPDIRTEAENVLRELRIMHCAEALEEIHEALASGAPLPGNGGPGTTRLVQSVANEEARLAKSGRLWDEGSAYDLAFFLTAQGQGWRLIKENIVCSKAPGEDGLCQKKRPKGEPNTANCQPECHNRIVLARLRRDTELVIDQYLDIARKAREDGQLLVLAGVMEHLKIELGQFSDLGEKYLADPEVQSLFALCDEPDAAEETA